ncbi:MAG: hypothetical protein SFU86_08705 [Pirellulaceae bacterium]|nr:hypothetical protein [Pirellulaceae bacterium]
MLFTVIAVALSIVLLAGMIAFQELGRWHGRRRIAADPEGARIGAGAIEGAMFALFGLLIAFTFYGAAGRFDQRRQLVILEANAIGTAWLRIDLLSAPQQPKLRVLFRDYVAARLAAYHRLPDLSAAFAELEHCNELQEQIWNEALVATAAEQSPTARMLLLPALNEMFDISAERTANSQIHPPYVIFALLFVVGWGCAALAGVSMAGGKCRSHLHVVLLAAITAVTVFVILDMEYPRLGVIRLDAIDQLLIQLQQGMDEQLRQG